MKRRNITAAAKPAQDYTASDYATFGYEGPGIYEVSFSDDPMHSVYRIGRMSTLGQLHAEILHLKQMTGAQADPSLVCIKQLSRFGGSGQGPKTSSSSDLEQAAMQLAVDIDQFLNVYYNRENDSDAFFQAKKALLEAKKALRVIYR